MYKFKIIDFGLSKKNYLFAVSLLDSNVGKYYFSYIPHGKYISIYMLEYLLGRKKELSAGFMDDLIDAVNDEVRTAHNSFIVISGEEESNKYSFLRLDGITGTKPLDSHDLKIFKEKILSDMDKRRTSGIGKQHHLGGRGFCRLYIQNKPYNGLRYEDRCLYVPEHLAADRSSLSDLNILISDILSDRKIGNNMSLYGLQDADRNIHEDLYVFSDASPAERNIKDNPLKISGDTVFADRDISSDLKIWNDILLFARNVRRATKILENNTEATRYKYKPVFLDGTFDAAFLKYRIYDGIIDKLLHNSERIINNNDTVIETIRSAPRIINNNLMDVLADIQSMRDLAAVGSMLDTDVKALRDINNIGGIVKSNAVSTRDISEDLNICNSIIETTRDIFGNMVIYDSYMKSIRPQKQLHIAEEASGLRDGILDLIISKLNLSQRYAEFGLMLPYMLQGKTPPRELALAKIDPALRNNVSGLILSKNVLSERQAVQGLYKAKAIFGERDILNELVLADGFGGERSAKNQMALLKAMQMKRDINKNTYIEIIKKGLGGFLNHSILWAYLMEDFLVGDGSLDYGLIDDTADYARRNDEDYGEVLDEKSLSSIIDRISILEESGILSRYNNQNSGLLVFNGFEAEKPSDRASAVDNEISEGGIILRPARIKVENPYGYMNYKKADLNLEQADLGGKDRIKGLLEDKSQLAFVRDKSGLLPDVGNEYNSSKYKLAIVSFEDLFLGWVKDRSGLLLDIGNEYDSFKIKEGIFDNDLLMGWPKDKLGFNGDELSRLGGISPFKYSLLDYLDRYGWVDDKKAFINVNTINAIKNVKDSFVDDTTIDSENISKRMALLSSGFIFSNDEKKQAEFLKQLFALLPKKQSDILISCLSEKEMMPGALLNDITSLKEAMPSEFLKDLLSLKEPMPSIESEMELGQGLIYDYSNDSIDNGMDPEYWDGGFGVPEDYDPLDPYNEYYPWSDEVSAYEMAGGGWIGFGDDNGWEVNKNLKSISYKGDPQGYGGMYYNIPGNGSYEFWTEFRVDGAAKGSVGIVFNYEDDNNYYRFEFSGEDENISGMVGPMKLYKIENGVERLKASPLQPHAWVKGRWHLLKVRVEGTRIKLYVDGFLQYDFVE